MRRKVMETQKSDEQRKKKSWKAEFCLFSFTPIQQSLKLLKKKHNETIDL